MYGGEGLVVGRPWYVASACGVPNAVEGDVRICNLRPHALRHRGGVLDRLNLDTWLGGANHAPHAMGCRPFLFTFALPHGDRAIVG